MSTIELSQSQRRILGALINLSEAADAPNPTVRGKDLAAEIDRNPGTIRNQMQSLRALQLVEGVPGPKGGYKPTGKAYETLDVARLDNPATIPVEREGSRVDGVNVEGIDFATVLHPDRCRAEVEFRGSLRAFTEGDRVTVGPTPSTGLRVSGIVDAVDASENALLLSVRSVKSSGETASAPAEGPVDQPAD